MCLIARKFPHFCFLPSIEMYFCCNHFMPYGILFSCPHLPIHPPQHNHFKWITWIWTRMILLQLQQQQGLWGWLWILNFNRLVRVGHMYFLPILSYPKSYSLSLSSSSSSSSSFLKFWESVTYLINMSFFLLLSWKCLLTAFDSPNFN